MGPPLDEPQSVGQGSDFGRSGSYGGLYGIRSGRRHDWNDRQPDRRHGQSLGRIKSELLRFHAFVENFIACEDVVGALPGANSLSLLAVTAGTGNILFSQCSSLAWRSNSTAHPWEMRDLAHI